VRVKTGGPCGKESFCRLPGEKESFYLPDSKGGGRSFTKGERSLAEAVEEAHEELKRR